MEVYFECMAIGGVSISMLVVKVVDNSLGLAKAYPDT